MRRVMVDQNDAAVGKPRAELEVQSGFRTGGERANDGDRFHLFRLGASHRQAGRDGRLGQRSDTVLPRNFYLFDGGDKLAVFDDCRRGVAEDAANSQNDHKKLSAISCQLSVKPTPADS